MINISQIAKKKPFYRIVIAEHTSPRDGKFVERIGSYNPMVANDHAERYVIDQDRAKHWLSVGAKPTERVAKIFGIVGLSEAPALREQPKKSAPKKKD